MMALLPSRLGIGFAVAAVAALATFAATVRHCGNAAKIAALQARIATLDRDMQIAGKAEAAAHAAAAALGQQLTNHKEHLDALEQELAARPDRAACRLNGADVERLRRIR